MSRLDRRSIPQAFALDSLEYIVQAMTAADIMWKSAGQEIIFEIDVMRDGECLGKIEQQDSCLCFVANGSYFGFVPGEFG